ncbi:sugar ABC transporter permease [Dactylosporangium matsuzakiense]|uniref:Xylose transport system permease protein XylH n=1 Tax=Dactylosporangium matsuzakiense TaxID=53360 RepID=A0A9W6KTC2_9ACTN|nr:ABC transporter permease [Dactylosporangium matsuzakiense]UWZ48972.1 ABC transporter permease [Dactylosporangium matsuzakiense]GLL07786.1 ABC transporter permease [Dactylosporangium matsuzakiense]
MSLSMLEDRTARRPSAGLGPYTRDYLARVRGGNMGALPAVLGLLTLVVAFSVARPEFVTAGNLANLLHQGAAVTVIAMGLVFVLLLGEIDLSAGFASGVCASVLAVLLTNYGFPWYFAVLGAVATGAAIGLVIGLLVAKLGIPSFVVTLAAFLAFQGAVLLLMKGGTIVAVDDPAIKKINFDGRFTPLQGWVLYGITIAAMLALHLWKRHSRVRHGLTADPISVIALRVVTVAVLLGAAVWTLNLERSKNDAISQRGVPMIVAILGLLLWLCTFVLNRTAFGRHVYAVGGNREASRRAGIHVDAIRIAAFVICSTMAAVGGIVAASRDASVNPNTGGSNVLLYAVGAAVIGGTSLFGGKGRVLNAVLGGAVVAVIENGMGLMEYSPGTKYIVTGVVLLLAAGIDALTRRRAARVGISLH